MEMIILPIMSPALHCDWQIDSWKQALITTVRNVHEVLVTWVSEGGGRGGGVGHDHSHLARRYIWSCLLTQAVMSDSTGSQT